METRSGAAMVNGDGARQTSAPNPNQPASRLLRPHDDRLRLFISYSREDLDFAEQLNAALELYGFSCTIDRHSIAGGEAWQSRLAVLISEADTIVFVVSPASATSETCAWEVSEANRLGKRIIPVCCRSLEGTSPPQSLSDLNFIFFYPEPKVLGSGFGSGLTQLVTSLETDLDWQRHQTRYLQRALEWDSGGRHANRLLMGNDIDTAKAWAADRPKSVPTLPELILDFLRESEVDARRRSDTERQQVEAMAAANAEREQALNKAEEALREAADSQRRRARIRNIALAVVSIFGILAAFFAKRAEDSRATAELRLRAANAIGAASSQIVMKFADQLDAKDQAEATTIFRYSAEIGSASAMNNLGVQYARGRGDLQQDFQKAREWYERSAAKGYPKATENLAFLYFNGAGVERDLDKARMLFTQAAEKGFASSMHKLGLIHLDGLGVPHDPTQAWQWLEKAAEKDYAPALFDIGRLYENGIGKPQDLQKAVEWYEKAAEKGGTRAMLRLGVLHIEGKGLEKDYVKAREWFEQADAAGFPNGAHNLGLIYEQGLGVPKDVPRARNLYIKAAARGEERSIRNLIRLTTSELSASGRYQEAAKALLELTDQIEKLERKWNGRPGLGTATILTSVAWASILAHDGPAAQSHLDRAMSFQLPKPPSLAALHMAHTLMVLGRTEEARKAYAVSKTNFNLPDRKLSWEYVVAHDFQSMRTAGIDLALMAEIEATYGLPKAN